MRAEQASDQLEYLAAAEHDRQRLEGQRAAKLAQLAEKRAGLDGAMRQLENLLHAALGRDSAIDLESLKVSPAMPAFRGRQPRRRSYQPQRLSRSDALKPWKRGEYQAAVHHAETAFKRDLAAFRQAEREHKAAEAQAAREAEERNQEIERFFRDFEGGAPAAIIRYFRLVLEGSAYPPGFPHEFDLEYREEKRELGVRYRLPAIDAVPATESYAIDRDSREIAATAMPAERRGQLYSATLARVCLRTLHELFSADRAEILESVAFHGYVDARDPRTGHPERFWLLALQVARGRFSQLALKHVEPLACLRGLGGEISGEPGALSPVADSWQEEAPGPDRHEPPELAERVDALEKANQAQGRRIKELRSEKQARAERMRELENAVEAKDDQIAELKRWLEVQQDENTALRQALRAKQDELSAAVSQLESRETQGDEIERALREEQDRAADLTSQVLTQRRYIAELEGKLEEESPDRGEPEAESPAETRAIVALDEIALEAGEIFTPIGDEEPRDESADAPIPPREVLPDRESPMTLRELLRGEGGTRLTDRPAGAPDDLLTDLPALVTIMGGAGSETSRLIRAIMESGWVCGHDALERRFKNDGAYTFANNIIDRINDRAYEQISNPLIIEEGDEWVIDEEFRDEIVHIFAHPEYNQRA